MSRNIGVAGHGYWGRNLVRNFFELGALRTVCDGNPLAEAVVREKYPEVIFCRDYSDVLADADIQAVVLATPAGLHFEMAKRALLAGKDVFVEKPR